MVYQAMRVGFLRMMSTAANAAIEPMTVQSPLIYSYALSKLDQAPPVYLKLETVQPSGSFKDRGMANLCRHLKHSGAKRLISSSGGNAGHSAAMCGRVLGLPVKVIVPTTTKPLMLEKIKAQGAEVEIYGDNWNAADAVARRLVEEDPQSAYISPYDHPLLWEGHSSIIDEIKEAGVKPGAIVASVGGGGLLCGVYEGLARVGWYDVTVVAAETEGAASFYEAFKAGRPVRLERIATVATSLGALEVTPRVVEYSRKQPTSAQIVTDAEAVAACRRLLDDYRILVEPACGAALALVYTDRHRAELAKAARGAPVVVIVCGGSAITPEILDSMERTGERSP